MHVGVVCVLKCRVILGGDYLFVTSQQLPQQCDLHLWAVCCIRIWALALAGAVPGPKMWSGGTATLPHFPGWNPGPWIWELWGDASRCEDYQHFSSACSLQAPRRELRGKDILQVSISAQPNWLWPFNQALHEDTQECACCSSAWANWRWFEPQVKKGWATPLP